MTGNGVYLVFDVGGTSIRSGVYDPLTARLLVQSKVDAPNFVNMPAASSEELIRALLQRLREQGRQIVGDKSIHAVCVAVPAPVTPEGDVWGLPTVLGPSGRGKYPLHLQLQALWPGRPVVMLNDVTAAGYFEVASGRRDFAILTVGSGIGLKIFLDAKARTGPMGRGGEIGHWVVDSEFPPSIQCDCGGYGHLGSLASGRGALALARDLAESHPDAFADSICGRLLAGHVRDLSTDMLVAAFRDGDPWAVHVLARSAGYLAKALAALHFSLGLEEIVLVGGFAHACGEPYRRLLCERAAQHGWDLGQDWNAIIRLTEQPDSVALEGGGVYLSQVLAHTH